MASMRDKLIEESVLFVSVLKWVFLASTVGLIVGISTAVFLKLLDGAISWASSFSHDFLFLPLALFLSALLVRRWEPESGGYGPERVIEAVHKKSGKINLAVVPTKRTVTILTAAAGGSVGQVGPRAQIGAALASASAGFIRLDDDDKKNWSSAESVQGLLPYWGHPLQGPFSASRCSRWVASCMRSFSRLSWPGSPVTTYPRFLESLTFTSP